ncbi:MAG: carbohydrate ABC transporter permease [Anaerolineae bacterium]|nr:carbohydrate ABC transporter permease [Anaerolineae bacterium]
MLQALFSPAETQRSPSRFGKDLPQLLAIIVLALGALGIIAPFGWTIQGAFGDPAEAVRLPPQWIPTHPNLDNFKEMFDRLPFGLFMWNSVKIATAVTIGQLITTSTAAFAFARLRFPGRNTLFFILLASLMIPGQITLVPMFIVIRQLGLYNTHLALILPGLINPFGVFFLRQYFLTIPTDYEDAARVDGAGPIAIFLRIMLPLAAPGMATLGILTFVGVWNDFLGPLVFIQDENLLTYTVGLQKLQGIYGGALGPTAAGTVLGVIPVLVVFIVLQRYIVKSVIATGIKG